MLKDTIRNEIIGKALFKWFNMKKLVTPVDKLGGHTFDFDEDVSVDYTYYHVHGNVKLVFDDNRFDSVNPILYWCNISKHEGHKFSYFYNNYESSGGRQEFLKMLHNKQTV